MIEFEDEDRAPGGAEVLGHGAERLPRQPMSIGRVALVIVLAATLLVGVVVGAVIGRGTAPASAARASAAPSPTPTFTPTSGGLTVQSRCAVQVNATLVVGVEVHNQTEAAMTLRDVRVALPMGGLRVLSTRFGACGSLEPRLAAVSLPIGGTAWLSATLTPLVACPQFLPVFLEALGQVGDGGVQVVQAGGFSDLGDVSWNDC